jgi:CRISPR-associated protein Csd1
MSWLARLEETYEAALCNNQIEDKPIPINHSIQNSHIQITIDGDGNFLHAYAPEKAEQIVLPTTEQSAGRSSGAAPHPFADKLQYVAADYPDFGGAKAGYFDLYHERLTEWAESNSTHTAVQAVLNYVSKRHVIADLVGAGIVVLDNEGLLATQLSESQGNKALFKSLPKTKGVTEQGGALVAWRVDTPQTDQPDTWHMADLQQAWIDYQAQTKGITALCYATGLDTTVASNHPAKIRHSGDKAKLISANDFSGFVFRGRFTDSQGSASENGLQGASVGQLSTQKAHNALQWLLTRKQAYRSGDLAVVAWAVSAVPPIQPCDDLTEEDAWTEVDPNQPLPQPTFTKSNQAVDAGRRYSNSLQKYMQGFHRDSEYDETITLMVIDSATPGRMSIAYYKDTNWNDYHNRIAAWHREFAWHLRSSAAAIKAGSAPFQVRAPTVYDVATALYGDTLKSNDKLKQQVVSRLLPVIVEQQSIPSDMLQRAFLQACTYHHENWQRQHAVCIACALYRGYCARLEKPENISMELDHTNTHRDYLFGRLLAYTDWLESTALQRRKSEGSGRATHSMKHWSRFANQPARTYQFIRDRIQPYVTELSVTQPGTAIYFNRGCAEIMALGDANDFTSDKRLGPQFLLGYHLQNQDLYKPKKERPATTEDEVSA